MRNRNPLSMIISFLAVLPTIAGLQSCDNVGDTTSEKSPDSGKIALVVRGTIEQLEAESKDGHFSKPPPSLIVAQVHEANPLVEIGRPALPYIEKHFSSIENPNLRSYIAIQIGRIGGEEASRFLLAVQMNDPDLLVRGFAS